MTPENKEKAKELIVNFLKEKFPEYPNVELEVVVDNMKEIYLLLVNNEILTKESCPPAHFQHVLVDQYRSAKIAKEMEDLLF